MRPWKAGESINSRFSIWCFKRIQLFYKPDYRKELVLMHSGDGGKDVRSKPLVLSKESNLFPSCVSTTVRTHSRKLDTTVKKKKSRLPLTSKITWRREWLPPVFLPGESHGQRLQSMESQRVRHDGATNIFTSLSRPRKLKEWEFILTPILRVRCGDSQE